MSAVSNTLILKLLLRLQVGTTVFQQLVYVTPTKPKFNEPVADPINVYFYKHPKMILVQ